MSETLYTVLLVLVAGLVTLALRAFPFILFGGKRQMPSAVKKVVDCLPPAIMGVLVIYCLKDAFIQGGTNLIASLGASLSVVLVHLWKRNTLASIALGTVVYMVLIRVLGVI